MNETALNIFTTENYGIFENLLCTFTIWRLATFFNKGM